MFIEQLAKARKSSSAALNDALEAHSTLDLNIKWQAPKVWCSTWSSPKDFLILVVLVMLIWCMITDDYSSWPNKRENSNCSFRPRSFLGKKRRSNQGLVWPMHFLNNNTIVILSALRQNQVGRDQYLNDEYISQDIKEKYLYDEIQLQLSDVQLLLLPSLPCLYGRRTSIGNPRLLEQFSISLNVFMSIGGGGDNPALAGIKVQFVNYLVQINFR